MYGDGSLQMDSFGGNQEGIWDSGTCAWMRATAKIAT